MAPAADLRNAVLWTVLHACGFGFQCGLCIWYASHNWYAMIWLPVLLAAIEVAIVAGNWRWLRSELRKTEGGRQ